MASAAVHLREFRESDDPGLRALFDDPDTKLWNAHAVDDLAAWRASQNEGADDFATWAVADADDDRFLGTVSVFQIDGDQSTAEIGYRVVPSERGRGVGTAGLTAGSARAFDERGLRRIQLFHAVGNAASCVVAERAGFRLEGTLRASYRYGDGQVHDEHLHAMLAVDPRPESRPASRTR